MAAVKKGIVKVGEIDFRWSVFRQPTWTSGPGSRGKRFVYEAGPLQPR